MLANIIRNRKKTALGGGGGGGIVIDNGDPFYSAVSLLLSMDGINGSTTFTDSGPNAIAVTATGASISTTQSKFGGASGSFDGTTSYLTAPGSALFSGTGDFTVEGWFYNTDAWVISANKDIIIVEGYGGSTLPVFYYGYYNGSRYIKISNNSNGFGISFDPSTYSMAANTWYHIAACRSSGIAKLFLNGVECASGSLTTSFGTASSAAIAVSRTLTSGFYKGFIDDLRISLFARYTSTFTPPIAALPTTASSTPADPYYGYTSLLLHMDGTNASTNFVDSGPSALTVTRTGTPAISTSQSKYGGSSVAFSGTTDRLGVASNALFAFGTGDFTVEFWVYFNSISTSFVQLYDTYVSGGFSFYWSGSTSTLIISNRSANQLSQAWSPSANTWYHLAVSRSGTSLKLFVNGTVLGSATASTSYAQAAIQIGGTADNASYTLNGYIDDLRITKYARYTSAFAPPAQAHLEYANGNDRHFSNVSLLLHMDGANGSTTFTDNSANALAVTAVGNAQISTTQSQFGGASAYFDGTGDYLTVASNAAIAFGLGDFTIECWVNFSALPTTNTIMGIANTMTSTTSAGFTHWWFGLEDSAGTKRLRLGRHGNASVFAYTNWTPSLNTWYFLQATRSSGSTIKLGINGVSQTVTSSGSNWVNDFSATGTLVVGYMATVRAFNGNIDEFRATKGVAREIAMPTSAFPNS